MRIFRPFLPPVLIWLAFFCACGGPSETVRVRAAEGAYLAEHLRCVERYDTTPEIDACRAAVRQRWGITSTVRDAGGDR